MLSFGSTAAEQVLPARGGLVLGACSLVAAAFACSTPGGSVSGRKARWGKGDGHGEIRCDLDMVFAPGCTRRSWGTVVADGAVNLMAAPGSEGTDAVLDQTLCELRGSPASA